MAHDVFISYASEDVAIAERICGVLESRNIRCWMAPRDVEPGIPFAEALIAAIDESGVVVLLFSSNSSTSTHVLSELDRAVMVKRIPVIPFRIEDVSPSKAMEYFSFLTAFDPVWKKREFGWQEPERHTGLFTVDRQPKPAVTQLDWKKRL